MKPSVEDEAIIERFADALWVERGLSRNTLMAYQTDLVKLASWLGVNCSRPLLSARRQDLLEYLAAQSLREGGEPIYIATEPSNDRAGE